MDRLIGVFSHTTLVELELMLITFLLCSLVGLERQVRQKSAGYRTHVLVGLGSCAFTLVSGFGFETVLGTEVNLDPSRIAAQIVSGIGFLGAGVIFKGRDVVRGLTTAATIWVAAAVGMSVGAGMISLGLILTVLHLITLFLIAPLIRRMPTADRRRIVQVSYLDGAGVLRGVLGLATSMGFSSSIDSSRRVEDPKAGPLVVMNIRFHGRLPIRDLVPPLMELEGVQAVSVRDDRRSDTDDDSV